MKKECKQVRAPMETLSGCQANIGATEVGK